MKGAGFAAALVVLGAMREVSGAGTLFANASVLLGESFRFLETTVIPEYKGFLLMALPPWRFDNAGFDDRIQAPAGSSGGGQAS